MTARTRVFWTILFVILSLGLWAGPARAQVSTQQTWTTETLSNGLRVIYAPMPTEPTTQVRVIYHVGSRDEKPDRQGFAHMFEHMMFRGSAHVKAQEHMRLVNLVGGYSNAFTSFDQTVYHDTLPATYAEMALWLEADRMASFKVSPGIFYTERLVVGEEWRMRLNQPYGGMFDLLMPGVFKVHPYRWTPIGSMAHLQAARTAELEQFFEKYYVPNNAILVVSGKMDVEKTKEQVHKYFGWIPASPLESAMVDSVPPRAVVLRNIPAEPGQTEPRRLEVKMSAPLARVLLAFHMPAEKSDDIDALNLLLSAVGDGQSSRLYRALVTREDPLAVESSSFAENLEDGGVMGVYATVLAGKDPAAVEKALLEQIALVREKPITADELEKGKMQQRLNLAQRFETPEKVASELGQEMLIHGNLDRVNAARARLEALTPADLLRVAQKYLGDNGATTMIITPGTPEGPPPGAPTSAPATSEPATTTLPAREVHFPADYPTSPPMTGKLPEAVFEKGVESSVTLRGDAPGTPPTPPPQPVRVIVMEDHRMPIINWSFTLRFGGHLDPAGKEGLAGITANMVRRGPKGKTFDQFNEELESRAISLEVADGGDNTRIDGSCLKEQFGYAMSATKQMLVEPAMDVGEFGRLKNQVISSLQLTLDSPQALTSRALTRAMYGNSPLGRLTTLKSLNGMTLEDVKAFYSSIYHATDGAVLVISGDISVPDGQAAAKEFLAALTYGKTAKPDYALPPVQSARRVILVDRPAAQQASILIATRAYSIASDEKFAGSLANQILSGGGIDSRLAKYVRADKGYVYSISGFFTPNRQAGMFIVQTDTRFPTTADTIDAALKVLGDMKADAVPPKELGDAQSRVAGTLLMSMQTLSDQANQRLTGILNGYPADYYDKYAQRIGQVTAAQVKDVMNKYVTDGRTTIVVAGPADVIKRQLEKFGQVDVITDPSMQ